MSGVVKIKKILQTWTSGHYYALHNACIQIAPLVHLHSLANTQTFTTLKVISSRDCKKISMQKARVANCSLSLIFRNRSQEASFQKQLLHVTLFQ